MKKGEKTTRTQHLEKIATFFDVTKRTVEKQLKEETKLSNLHTKKAFWCLENGLSHYDMNEILREVTIELSEKTNLIFRFLLIWNIGYDGKTKQELQCICNGAEYNTKTSGIEGINSILEQIGLNSRLEEPTNIFNLVVWK